jgi:hypothetical protein
LHARAGVPDRWDVSIDRRWAVPGAISRRRYASQVRQDLWRAARGLRGFVPRVLVGSDGEDILITGGGVLVTGHMPPGLPERLAAILDNPNNRRRWGRHASARKDL